MNMNNILIIETTGYTINNPNLIGVINILEKNNFNILCFITILMSKSISIHNFISRN